jgi:hypothetical protein
MGYEDDVVKAFLRLLDGLNGREYIEVEYKVKLPDGSFYRLRVLMEKQSALKLLPS